MGYGFGSYQFSNECVEELSEGLGLSDMDTRWLLATGGGLAYGKRYEVTSDDVRVRVTVNVYKGENLQTSITARI